LGEVEVADPVSESGSLYQYTLTQKTGMPH